MHPGKFHILRLMIKTVFSNLAFLLVILPTLSFGQLVYEQNFADLFRNGRLNLKDREVTLEHENNREFVRLGNAMNGSAILLPALDFQSGRIELVVKGMDIFQGSFVGIAFHAQHDSLFDLVYCRPFNFRTSDSVRRIHMIQYAYFPKMDWQILRSQYNGIYEKGIENPPEANEWFKLTLEINEKTIKAFINHSNSPSLVVKKLNNNSIGKIGIFGTNADFESIRIEYEK